MKGIAKLFTACLLCFACPAYAQDLPSAESKPRQNLPSTVIMPPVSQDGLTVGQPKVYDNFYLQQQLHAFRVQLEQLQALDRASLVDRYGNVQGSTLQQRSYAVQASGPSTPSVITKTGDANSVESTASSMSASSPSIAPSSLSMPVPTMGASDSLAEQVQLQYQIMNLQMLLDGAVSDRVTRQGMPRRTVTLGFPVSIEPPNRDNFGRRNNSVAEVKISLCHSTPLASGSDLSITNLLPREHTYNVAGLTDKSFSASAGGVLGNVLSVGGGFFTAKKKYYLVQQQETVAFQTPETQCAQIPHEPESKSWAGQGFVWQVRPVLGSKQVRSGMQTNMVQFTFEEAVVNASGERMPQSSPQDHLKACVQVGWHTLRHGGQAVEMPGPLVGQTCFDIPKYRSMPVVKNVSATNNGGGDLDVVATGSFQPGTTVWIGSAVLPDSRVVISPDAGELRFTVSGAELVQGGAVWLRGRDGTTIELRNPKIEALDRSMKIVKMTTYPVSATVSHVTVDFDEGVFKSQAAPCRNQNAPCETRFEPWVILAGNKLYGLSDAPFLKNLAVRGEPVHRTIEAELPTALLRNGQASLQRPFYDREYSSRALHADSSDVGPAIDKLTILSTKGGNLHISVTGSNLNELALFYPTAPGNVYAAAANPSFASLDLDAVTLSSLKQIVLCSGACNKDSIFIQMDVPSTDPPSAPSPELTNGAAAKVGSQTVSINGTVLEQFTNFEYAGQKLTFRIVDAPAPHIVLDLPPSIASRAGTYTLIASTGDGKLFRYLIKME